LFCDWNPYGDTTNISWKQLDGRIIVTYQDILEFWRYNVSNFQIEMFYNGLIRITYLEMSADYGVAGLSGGDGVPSVFIESDLSNYGPCGPYLPVGVPAAVTEGDGLLTGLGIVSIETSLSHDLLVSLSSDDPSELTVPNMVTIPVGQTSAIFDLVIEDDTLLDGTQIVTITASASDYVSGTGTTEVSDNETAVLTISVPELATEGDGLLSGQGRVTISRTPDEDISVSLSSDDTSEVTVPETVTIPAGQATALFDITIVYDGETDAMQSAGITASVTGWTSASDTIQVIHNEMDFLTEQFSYYDNNDLSFQMITFTPDASGNSYTACREQTFVLPTDSSDGTPLYLWDDDYELISLAEGAQVPLYGVSYPEFYE